MESADSVAAVASALIALLSLVATVALFLLGRSDARRADTAAARANEASERAAAASATLATIQRSIFDGPPWTIEWSAGDSFLVTNTSPIDALQVEVDAFPATIHLSVDESQLSPFDVGAKSAFKFMFSPTYDDGFRRDLVLRWRREQGGATMTWSHPIPLRPDR